MFRRVALAISMLVVPYSANAADLAVREPVVIAAPVVPSLWRGHFSGGRNYDPRNLEIVAVDWTDQVSFFPDDGSCRRWISDLRRQWRTYQGFTGCLRIR